MDGIATCRARALVKTAIVATTPAQGLLREGDALLSVSFTATVAPGRVVEGADVALLDVPAALILDAASFAFAALRAEPAGCPARPPPSADETIASAPASPTWRASGSCACSSSRTGGAGMLPRRDRPGRARLVTETLGQHEADFGAVLAAWGAGA